MNKIKNFLNACGIDWMGLVVSATMIITLIILWLT